jgi:hypothetical protein
LRASVAVENSGFASGLDTFSSGLLIACYPFELLQAVQRSFRLSAASFI